jgi:transcriptional regulator with XRE-family HTH domain
MRLDRKAVKDDGNQVMPLSPGRNLRLLRLRRGLTAQQLAIELAVYHYDYIEEVERGLAHLPAELYPRFASVLGLSTEEFAALMWSETAEAE